jgi:putative transposase
MNPQVTDFHRMATVIDLLSHRLLGYAMGTLHDAELVVASLNIAAATRGGDVKGVIFHSDRGSEYGSRRFRRVCRHWGVTQSMGRVGSCFDNPVIEAFNSVHRGPAADRDLDPGFCNTHRLHSVCGYQSPIDYEHDHRANSVLELAAWKFSTVRGD